MEDGRLHSRSDFRGSHHCYFHGESSFHGGNASFLRGSSFVSIEASIYLHQCRNYFYSRGSFHLLPRKNRACHGPVGPAWPTKFSYDGPRPGPAHQFFIWWATDRPGSSIFHLVGRGPARPIKFSSDVPRPGSAHQSFRGWASARPSPSHFHFFTARPGPAH